MAALQCPGCKLVLSEKDPAPAFCSGCGMKLQGVQDWVPVARMTNLAEAGYMADYLAQEEIATDIAEENDFNAAAGAWLSSFIVRVPREDEQSSRRLLSSGEYGEEDQLPDDWHRMPGSGEGFFSWAAIKRICFVFLVVGLVYLAMDLQRRQPGRGQEGERLSFEQFMSQQPGPWIHLDPTGVRSELHFNPEQNCMMLEQDRDGDGVIDYYQTFQTR